MKAIGDGRVIDIGFDVDLRDQQIETLKAENRRLERQAADAERTASRAQEDATRALSELRRQLGPLFRALQMVFGELDAAGVTESPMSEVQDNAARTKWAKWIERFGVGSPASRFIEALLDHGELTAKQMKTAGKMGENTVYQMASKLGQLGLVVKNGSNYALKQL